MYMLLYDVYDCIVCCNSLAFPIPDMQYHYKSIIVYLCAIEHYGGCFHEIIFLRKYRKENILVISLKED